MYEIRKPDTVEKVRHPEGNYKASFDLTKFFGRDAFREVIDKLGLKDHGEVDVNGLDWYVWSNDDLVIKTSSPVFTDERGMIDGTKHEPAYAGYIHIVGDKSEVVRAYNLITWRSRNKDSCLNGNKF